MDERITAGNPVRLDPEQTDRLLKRFNVPTVPQRVVYSPEPGDVVRAAEEFGYPVVLKAFTPTLVHKSDIGGVRMFLHDDHQVSRAAIAIQERVPDLIGYLLQSQAPGGHEVVIECSRRAGFGPVIQIGLGGGWAELVDDVSVRIAPLDFQMARAMIDELRGAPLLYGYHGARAANIDALVEMLVNLSRLVVQTPEVMQLDINPAIAGAYEVVAVDTRVFWDAARVSVDSGIMVPETEAVSSVRRLFSPGSIAVIGPMTEEGSPGRRLLETLRAHGYAGDLYPVDSGATEVLGLRSYPTTTALPAVPDLACIALSPESVAETVRACGELGIQLAVVYPTGEELQSSDLRDAAGESGMRICGPDTVGFVIQDNGLHVALEPVPDVREVPTREISFLTQSATLGSWLLGRALEAGVGFSAWIDAGQEIDFTLSDYLHYLSDDPDSQVIAIYLETLRSPASFIRASERARSAGKSVLVYRPNPVDPSREHGSDDRAFNAAVRQAGVARVPDLQSLADAALALAWQPVPHGEGVGVISTSRGASRVIANECARLGLTLPELGSETVKRIREIETPLNVSGNPVDIGASTLRRPGVLGELADALLRDPSIDSLALVLTQLGDIPDQRIAEVLGRAAQRSGKPVLISSPGPEPRATQTHTAYRSARLPRYTTPDRVVRTLRVLVDISDGRHEQR